MSDAIDELEAVGFRRLAEAPKSIIGEDVILLHWSGATECTVLRSKKDAAEALGKGWTRYRKGHPND